MLVLAVNTIAQLSWKQGIAYKRVWINVFLK